MQILSPHQLLITLSLVLLLQPISGLVTLQTIRNLTALTDECKERIVESGNVAHGIAGMLGGFGRGAGQVVFGGGEGDGDEVEDVSSYWFQYLEWLQKLGRGMEDPSFCFGAERSVASPTSALCCHGCPWEFEELRFEALV